MVKKIKIDRKQVYDKYDNHCSYCGTHLQYKKMQVDHIKPQWTNDPNMNHIDNLNPSCKRCNHYKRGDNLEGFRKKMITLHERIAKNYINKVAIDYGIITLKPFDGLFYFEKFNII